MSVESRQPRRPLWKPSKSSRAGEFLQRAANRVPRFIWSVFVAIARVLAIALFVAAAIYGYRELTRATLIIEPISVPKQYADAGVSPEVMANRIKDALTEIETTTRTIAQKDRLAMRSDEVSAPDVEVPGTKLGLKTVIEIARAILPFLPQPKSAGGEITLSTSTNSGAAKVQSPENVESKVQIILRIKGGADPSEPITISPPANDSGTVARSAAEAILGRVNPYILAVYRVEHGDPNSAIATAQGMIRDLPQDRLRQAAAYILWGDALFDQKKYDEAIAEYQKAIALDPKSAWPYNDWGLALFNQKKYDEAIAEYQKAIELDPKEEVAYSNWGYALEDLKKYDEAIAKYQKAIDLDPKDALAYNGWGVALLAQKKYGEAIIMYRKAIELDPKYALAYNNWGAALDRLGRASEAQQKYAKYRELQ